MVNERKAAKFWAKPAAATICINSSAEGKEFAKLMEQHEIIMSDVLETKTVKEKLFPDFKGVVKSLGAWGGDFVMVISKENPTNYFINKGYPTVFSYEEMVL